jgi:hypothetical protein
MIRDLSGTYEWDNLTKCFNSAVGFMREGWTSGYENGAHEWMLWSETVSIYTKQVSRKPVQIHTL